MSGHPNVWLPNVVSASSAVKRVGRLRVAAYEDVKAALTAGREARARIAHAEKRTTTRGTPKQKPPGDMVDEAAKFIDAAPTPRERKCREREVLEKAGDLMIKYAAN